MIIYNKLVSVRHREPNACCTYTLFSYVRLLLLTRRYLGGHVRILAGRQEVIGQP